MPNALVSDCVTRARRLLNEPSTNGRFSDTAMIGFCDDASKYLNRDILFPDARYVIPTVANQQEYSMDPFPLRVDRVYLNGQLLVPVDGGINTMEGHQIGLYDQTAQGSVQAIGGGGPPGQQGSYMPQWIAAAPVGYPYASNSYGGSAPTGLPFSPGMRGRYYWRGGVIGVEQIPNTSGELLVIEGILMVPVLTALTQYTMFPDTWALALAWKICEFARYSDDSDRAAEARNYAAQQYDILMRDARMWNRRRDGDQPRTMFVRTRRSAYITGNARGFNGYGGSGWGIE